MHKELDLQPSPEADEANLELLRENEYPGRLIAMGRGAGRTLIQAYVLMGRSENSRNRALVEVKQGIKVVAPDKTQEEMEATPNSELIYYQAMKSSGPLSVVSNGAQTLPIFENLSQRKHYMDRAVNAAGIVDGIDLASYEPDAPNYTPRIAGAISLDLYSKFFGFSIIRRNPETEEAVQSTWGTFDLDKLPEKTGYCIHTYNEDGDPLPSFDGEPYPITFAENARATATMLWNTIPKDNLVGIATTEIPLLGIERSTIN